MSETVKELAKRIARDLFTNGSGQRADRLVLTVDGPPKRDLGGWCEGAVADRLEQALALVGAEPKGETPHVCWWCKKRITEAGPFVSNDELTISMCGTCAREIGDFLRPRVAALVGAETPLSSENKEDAEARRRTTT